MRIAMIIGDSMVVPSPLRWAIVNAIPVSATFSGCSAADVDVRSSQ
jgi:hypothetical protein